MNIQATNSATATIKMIMEQTKAMADLQKDMRSASIEMGEKLLKVSVAGDIEAAKTNSLIDILA